MLCPQGCEKCTDGEFCRECSDGFYAQVVNGEHTGSCMKCDSPCYGCMGSSSNCLTCLTGYYLSGPGKCTACKEGCLSCDSEHGCLVCGIGYTGI